MKMNIKEVNDFIDKEKKKMLDDIEKLFKYLNGKYIDLSGETNDSMMKDNIAYCSITSFDTHESDYIKELEQKYDIEAYMEDLPLDYYDSNEGHRMVLYFSEH